MIYAKSSRFQNSSKAIHPSMTLYRDCSGLMKPDTHLGENARQIEVSDEQTTPLLYS